MVTEANWKNWQPDDLRPYFNQVLECFGCERLIFGGDWPVVTQASSLTGWIETLEHLLERVAPSERHQIFVENAKNFYRLSERKP